MTATPYFVYRSFVAARAPHKPAPCRLTLRTRSTPGRLRHVWTRLAVRVPHR
jgi:hypothetical protein